MEQTLLVFDREEWRRWLEANHRSKQEIWLIYHKKHSGQPRISYDDAVEEALCFGWIDSIVKRIDDDRYMQKFTPRTNPDKWSELNVKRAKKMIAAGKMTLAGRDKLPRGILDGSVKTETPVRNRVVPMPVELEQSLAQHPDAFENFSKLASSYQKNFKLWIGSAKKPETRLKRAKEAIELLRQNKPLGLK